MTTVLYTIELAMMYKWSVQVSEGLALNLASPSQELIGPPKRERGTPTTSTKRGEIQDLAAGQLLRAQITRIVNLGKEARRKRASCFMGPTRKIQGVSNRDDGGAYYVMPLYSTSPWLSIRQLGRNAIQDQRTIARSPPNPHNDK